MPPRTLRSQRPLRLPLSHSSVSITSRLKSLYALRFTERQRNLCLPEGFALMKWRPVVLVLVILAGAYLLITRFVPIVVVYRFETVDIATEHRQGMSVALRAQQFPPQRLAIGMRHGQ